MPPKCFAPAAEKVSKVPCTIPWLRDVDPGAGRHLAIHRQAKFFEPVEFRVVRPMANEIRIGDQDARCFIVGAEDAHRFARLNEKRFVIL